MSFQVSRDFAPLSRIKEFLGDSNSKECCEVESEIYNLFRKANRNNEISKVARGLEKLDNDFEIDNPEFVYSTANEFCTRKVRKVLHEVQGVPRGARCAVGVSCWHNFDIAFSRKSDLVVLMDNNTAVKNFNNLTLQALKCCSSRQEFAQFMLKSMQEVSYNQKYDKLKVASFDHSGPLAEQLKIELVREGSWLSADESYGFIRKLVLNDKVPVFRVNLTAIRVESDDFNPVFGKIRGLVESAGLKIDTLYISNIIDYLSVNNHLKNPHQYARNVRCLTDQHTIVIASTITESTSINAHALLMHCIINQIPVSEFTILKRRRAAETTVKQYAVVDAGENGYDAAKPAIAETPLQPEETDIEDFKPILEKTSSLTESLS